MRTTDPVKHEAKRRHLLSAAAVCFARKGFQQTRTADICAQAGVSSGALFHYFPSKQAIFEALVEEDGCETAEYLDQVADSADPLGEILRLMEAVAELAADSGYATLALEISAEANRNAEIAALVARNDRELRDGLAGLLARAADQGQIDAALDPETAATWVAALIDGVFARVAVDPDFAPLEHLPALRLVVPRVLGGEPRP